MLVPPTFSTWPVGGRVGAPPHAGTPQGVDVLEQVHIPPSLSLQQQKLTLPNKCPVFQKKPELEVNVRGGFQAFLPNYQND